MAAAGVLFVALQAALLVLLVIVHVIPDSLIYSKLGEDLAAGLWSTTTDHPHDGISRTGLSDAYTDCIAFTAGLGAASNPLWEALTFPHLGSCEPAAAGIQALNAGTTPPTEATYARYWGGFAVITRPFLALGGIGALRLFVITAVIAVAAVFVVVARRRLGTLAAVVLLAPVLVSTNFATQTTTGFLHLLEFTIALAGGVLGFMVGSLGVPMIVAAGVLAGSVFVYVDFLHNPPIAWILFTFGAIASAVVRGAARPWMSLGSAALAWIGGFGLTWAARWAIGLAVGALTVDELTGKVGMWTGGAGAEDEIPTGLGVATKKTVGLWLDVPSAWPIAIGALALLVWTLVRLIRRKNAQAIHALVILAAAALLAPVWIETLSGHSTRHAWFVYRVIPLAVGVVAAACLLSMRASRAADDQSDDTRRPKVATRRAGIEP